MVGREILHRVQDLWLLDRFFLAADESCPEPRAPAHGSIHCSMVNSDKVCSVICDAGFVFSSPPSAYYTCSKNGVWTPSRSIPDCVNGRLWGWSRDIGYALAVGYFFQVNIAYFGQTPIFSHEGDTCKARIATTEVLPLVSWPLVSVLVWNPTPSCQLFCEKFASSVNLFHSLLLYLFHCSSMCHHLYLSLGCLSLCLPSLPPRSLFHSVVVATSKLT